MPMPVLVALLAVFGLLPPGCAGLTAPVPGPVVREFAPEGSFGGHWGIDLAAPEGSEVRVASSGVVTFSGTVAGMVSVTVGHGGGLRTSYSFLAERTVEPGQFLRRGTIVGRSGLDHGAAVVHLSVRLGRRYLDPEPWLGCHRSPRPGLHLAPVPRAYALARATRHPRRNLRSPTCGPPLCRGGGLPRPGPGHRHVHSGRIALAKGGSNRGVGRGPVEDDGPGGRGG